MCTLLLVEDNPRDLRFLTETVPFAEWGLKLVGTAQDGEEALELVENVKPDVIITDISMPVMNGIEMAQSLSAAHPEIKILFMSHYDDFSFAKSAIELMIHGYILKPIDQEELEKACKKLVTICVEERKKANALEESIHGIIDLRQLILNLQRLDLEYKIPDEPLKNNDDIRQWLNDTIYGVQQFIEEKNTSPYAGLVKTVKKVVKNRYAEPLSVPDIAAEVYLSPKQANAIFKREEGLSIFDYLVSFRMERAKILLKETNLTVQGIAEAVGYSNKSHFAIMFRRHTGMTPAEYKNRR
jgi:two-component system response regulator YesN